MQKKTKIFLIVFGVIVVGSVIFLIIYYRNLLRRPFGFGVDTSVPIENPAGYIPEANPIRGAPLNPLEEVRVNPFRE